MVFDKSTNAKYYSMESAPMTGELIVIKRGGKFAYEFIASWNGTAWEVPGGRFAIVEPTCWRYPKISETSV